MLIPSVALYKDDSLKLKRVLYIFHRTVYLEVQAMSGQTVGLGVNESFESTFSNQLLET